MKKYLLCFLGCLVAISMASAQSTRPVHWVHGLNGSSTTWNFHKSYFESARRIDGPASYNSTGLTNLGLVSYSNAVRSAMIPNANAIAIGHSMGGVTVRDIARYDAVNSTTTFGGFIAAGAPLTGAKILNSISNGSAENFILNGVDEIVRGPATALGLYNFFVAGEPVISSVLLIKSIRKGILKFFLSSFDFPLNDTHAGSAFGVQTFDDLKENSAYMNAVNTFSGPYKDRLFIYGNESSPIHWRLASSTLKSGSGASWTSTDDEYLVNLASNFRSIYNTQNTLNIAAAILAYSTFNFGVGAGHTYMASQWRKGRDWLDMSESYWAGLIGAHGTTYYAGMIDTYEDQCDMPRFEECFGNGDDPVTVDCEDCTVVPVTYAVWIPTQTGSDGLVAVYSQLAEGTPWAVASGRTYQAVNVNHMEMRGHTHMTAELSHCFDRLDFFSTPLW